MTPEELEDAKIRIGNDVERYQSSELGATMIELAGLKSHEALAKLGRINPKDTDGIIELQNEVGSGDRFIQYMEELLEQARSTLVQRAEEQSDD